MDYIGNKLIKNHSDDISLPTICGHGKVIGLYFSASWCGPCKQFTPKLIEFYRKFKTSPKASQFEIVFISSDKDQNEFNKYFSEMPWLAVPYMERDIKTKVSKRFKIKGIPSLVIINTEDGKLITLDGRDVVVDDPEGENFPWRPRPLSEVIAGPLVKDSVNVDILSAVRGKVVGLYFSAHWCPPCKQFTPLLMEIYQKLKERNRNFEVVFVSSDKTQATYKDYRDSMPWPALPYGDRRCEIFGKYFRISGIPTLIILNEEMEVITTNGRGAIQADPTGIEFPWPEKAIVPLNDVYGGRVNEVACMLYFTGGVHENIVQARKVLQPVAEQHQVKMKEELLEEVAFLYEDTDGDELAESLRDFTRLRVDNPLLALIDLPGEKVFEVERGVSITSELIQSTLKKYLDGSLPSRSLR